MTTAQLERRLTSSLDELPDSHRCREAGIRIKNARHVKEAKFELVTPEIAAEWLDDNAHNRHFSPARASTAARDMADGHWQETGEPVQFDVYGHLLNGQHRLNGIVDSGVAVELLVVRGLQPEAQEVMDSGARRSSGDALSLRDIGDGKMVASVVRRIIQWDEGVRTRDFRLSRYSATTPQVLEFVDANPRVIEIAEKARAANGAPMSQSVRGLLWWLFDAIDPAQADEFFARLNDGAGLEKSHPILTLREKLTSERAKTGKRLTETAYTGMAIRAWNAWRDGRPLIRIQVDTGKDNSVPTPK